MGEPYMFIVQPIVQREHSEYFFVVGQSKSTVIYHVAATMCFLLMDQFCKIAS